VVAPSLAVFKARLDGALSNLVWWKVSLPITGAWNQMVCKVIGVYETYIHITYYSLVSSVAYYLYCAKSVCFIAHISRSLLSFLYLFIGHNHSEL